jgi:Tfp pilus assembly protein PilF
MIELMLQAEHALGTGRLDQAEKLYWQVVESDARNAIAVVGLARVAIERGDEQTAREFARRALALDPENAAALRLTSRLARGAGGK